MKRSFLNRIIIALAGCAVWCSSCSEFLEYSSESSFSNQEIFATEDDMLMALNSIYVPLLDDNCYGEWGFYLVSTSDMEYVYLKAPGGNMGDVAVLNVRPNHTRLLEVWTQFWKALYRANDVIEGIEKSDIYRNNPTATVLQYYGEAVTLRAMIYYDLVRLWGDVPLITHPQTYDEEINVPATDRDEILKFCIEDMIRVEPTMLYASQSSRGVESVNRGYCQALIARMALLRGGYSLRPDYDDPMATGTMERNDDYLDYYRIANTYAKKLIDSGEHSLSIGFEQVFLNEMLFQTAQHSDVVFELPYRTGISPGGRVGYVNGIRIASGNTVWNQSLGQISITDPAMHLFDPADTRRWITGCLYQYNSSGSCAVYYPVCLGKWDKSKTNYYWTSGRTGVGFPMMRYADVLLMYAETENELKGAPSSEAKDALKQVRRRAFPAEVAAEKVDGYVDALTSKEDFFEAIVDERAMELTGEWIRRTDLARWNLIGPRVRQMIRKWVDMSISAQYMAGSLGKDFTFPNDEVPYPDISTVVWYKIDENNRLQFQGFDETLENVPGYKAQKWNRNAAVVTGGSNYGPADFLKYSFAGWFVDGELPADDAPVRYIMPIPQLTVDLSEGTLKNYYGYGM